MRKMLASAFVVAGLFGAGLVRAEKPNIQPGKWSVTVTVDLEGAPIRIPPRTIEKCVKPEDVKDPVELLKNNGNGRSKDCTTKDIRQTGNKITWAMECNGPDKGSGTGEMTMAQGSYQGVMKMQFTDKSGVVHKATSTYAGKRVGECQ